ncbi:ABC transporter permease [Arthrobacter sp. MYb213]|uniref:ABC transporter permease n=1 Tax=Arthrobacter sp. MYb213 TaxID=1848595 RepID=UPI000CFB9883|nr:ABC transporter permease [Arthrobacter sp. MYb213]PRB68157.1 ABC transporter permease [Arthrobacter sp. MYb213]
MKLLAWLGRKVGGALVVLWLVATAIFIGVRLIPGDPAEAIMGGPGSQASAEALANARSEYGLDLPIISQYFLFLAKLIRLDFGTSYSFKDPVLQIMGEVLPPTINLALMALVVAWLLALLFALLAMRANKVGQLLGNAVEIVAAAVPHFWLGAVLIMLFSSMLGWLPAVANGTPAGLVLPVLTLALPLAGFLTQLMRDSLNTAMGSQFALAARARGESRLTVFRRHGLRHAALPALGLTGWAFSSLLSGAVVVEAIFARPGLGRSLLSAVLARDIPMVTGIALFSALVYIVVMALTEAIERLIDPAGAES